MITTNKNHSYLFSFSGIFLILLFTAFSYTKVQAEEPTPVPDDAVNAVAQEMYCPVCENIPLDVCGTQACHQWRELIRQKLEEGWTTEQIKDYFVTQYGDRVLAEPPREGLNWLVYIIPPLVIPIGVFFAYRVVRSWQEPQQKAPSVPLKEHQDEYANRLEEELKRRN